MEERTLVRRNGYRQKMPALIPRALADDLYGEIFGTLTSDRDRAIVALLVSSAARASELLGMNDTDIERHHPGTESIQFPPTIARAWQERLWTLPNGQARNDVHSILVVVRAFYLDIARWAAETPDVWAPRVARAPISDGDLRPFQKIKLRHRARMHARTRTLMPFLSKLVSSAHQSLVDATELLALAQAATPGSEFQALGQTYRRKPIPSRADVDGALAPVTVVCLDATEPKTINCRTLEDDAFLALGDH